MTFEEWIGSTIEYMAPEDIALVKLSWQQSRLETMIEIRDWLLNELKNKPWNPAALAALKDICVIMAANVERGGAWASSIPSEM